MNLVKALRRSRRHDDAQPAMPTGGNRYYQGDPSDHFDGRLFFNPGGEAPAGFRELLKWQFGGGRAKWPRRWPSPDTPAMPAPRVTAGALRITMVGHSTLLVQIAGINVLTDPVWSQRVSPLSFAGPSRVNPPGIRFEDLPKIDLVLVSHNHYDHMDTATLRRLVDVHDPRIVVPLGNERLVTEAAPKARVTAHDWNDEVGIGDGVSVHLVPVHHWSARGARDRRMALWCGFVVDTPDGKVFFAGDTGFHGGEPYRHLQARHGSVRAAILPIGAYEPRWFMKPQHQNPDEAVRGMLLSNAEFAVACHWGTFQLTNEPITEPREKLAEALGRHGVDPDRFRALRPGETWDVPPSAS
jgi:L-ascorbate metabolism protein UlaG (beta-lactamase superfamily)